MSSEARVSRASSVNLIARFYSRLILWSSPIPRLQARPGTPPHWPTPMSSPPSHGHTSLFPFAALYCGAWRGVLLLWECCKRDLFGKRRELWEYRKWACGGHEKEAVSEFVHPSPCLSRMPVHRPVLFMHYYSLFTLYLFVILCLLFKKRYKDTKKKKSKSRRFGGVGI